MGLFTQTKRFTAAVELINGLETKPLSKILGRILSALPEKKVRTIVRGETVPHAPCAHTCRAACVRRR